MKIAVLLSCMVAFVILKSSKSDVQRQRALEFETFNATQSGNKSRTQASLGSTLQVVDTTGSQSIVFDVCILPETGQSSVNFIIDTIQYSNDGDSDDISITVNGTSYANVSTYQNFNAVGTGWNVMKNTERLGTFLSLPAGNYSVVIRVQTDANGVELDLIRVYLEYQSPSMEIYCGERTFNN